MSQLTKPEPLGRFAMRYLAAILSMLLFQPARAGEKSVAPDFSRYPQTESFRHYLSITNAVWMLQHTNLLAISAFPNGSVYALQYFVTETGQEYDCRNVYNWAIQASNRKQLSEPELTSLRSAIRELPAGSVSPPIERLVVVSFRAGTNWVTRSYESTAPPQSMRQIYDIVGERFESKEKR